MSTRTETVTNRKINELEDCLQEGFPCKAYSLKYHLAENATNLNAEPIVTTNHLSLYQKSKSASLTITFGKYPIKAKESGEILDIMRNEINNRAEILVNWGSNRICSYMLYPKEKLPIQLKYKPEDNPSRLNLPKFKKRN